MKDARNGTGEREAPLLPLFERALARVAPHVALRRARARYDLLKVAHATRTYEAARGGRRLERWATGTGSADGETKASLRQLRDRSRALCRDTAYGRRTIGQWAAWLVGQGWSPAIDDDDQRAAVWTAWAGPKATACDVEGVNTFRGLQRIVARCLFESGEVLVLRRWAPEQTLPLQLAVYEPDYLDDAHDGASADGKRTAQGIERDRNNRITGYWLHQEHPGSLAGLGKPSRFYPAADVLHLFARDRAGQSRGIPIMHAITIRMHDWDETCDAKVVQAKAGASFVGIEHDLSADVPLNPDDNKQPKVRDLEPGSIISAAAGKTITFNDTPDPGPMSEMASEFLHEVAAGTDLPYEILTGNIAKVSFSSARIGYFPFYTVLDDVQGACFVPLFLNGVARWFHEAAILRGFPGFDLDELFDWTPPARPAMDPQAEANATVTNIRSGMETISDALRARGKNPRRHLERLAKDWETVDLLKLSLDCDPRKFGKTASGGGSEVMEANAAAAQAAAEQATAVAEETAKGTKDEK